jgi:HSP90 family molecular chaperone
MPAMLFQLVPGTWHIISVVSMCFQISKATVSERLSDSPCALIAGMFGWTGNMERLAISNAHQKSDDPQRSYYLNQKKTLEINPRHPLIKELLRRVQDDPSDPAAKDIAVMMFRTGMSYGFSKHDRLCINTVVFSLEHVTEVFLKCFCFCHFH